MKKFDYSFLDNGLLPANLINITGTIYSLKAGAKIRQDEYEKIFTELEKIDNPAANFFSASIFITVSLYTSTRKMQIIRPKISSNKIFSKITKTDTMKKTEKR